MEEKKNEHIFSYYKPLRNHLYKIKVDDGLFIVWAYIQHLQFNQGFPPEIEVIPEFAKADYIQKIRWSSPWELETLAKEVILNGHDSVGEKSLTRWNYFSGALNKLKALENEIGGQYTNTENILVEMFRIAHRQFPWQMNPNGTFIIRHYKIYGTAEMSKIIEETTGLNTKDLYTVGMVFIGAYLNRPAIKQPINVEVRNITTEKIDKFLSIFSISLTDLKHSLQSEHQLNSRYGYAYSSLRARPIIDMMYRGEPCYVCPLPTLLYWQITNGIYYSIYKHPLFDKSFGSSFQSYVGDVLIKATQDSEIQIYPEQQYKMGKDSKDSIDWIVSDGDSILFVECKTKRLIFTTKSEIEDTEAIQNELNKMSDFVVQCYKTIADYQNGHYPHFSYDSKLKLYPVIVTLEHWYVFGGKFLALLDQMIEQKMRALNLNLDLLKTSPYAICAVEDFEVVAQLIKIVGIRKFMEPKVSDSEKREWEFGPYINSEFKDQAKQVKSLFNDEYDALFAEFLAGRRRKS